MTVIGVTGGWGNRWAGINSAGRYDNDAALDEEDYPAMI